MVYGQSAGCDQQRRGVTRAEGAAARVLHILLPLRICAPHLATQLLPLFTGPSSPLRAAMCSPQPACRRPCCQNRPPNRPGTMASSPPSTGKHAAAAFTGLMGEGGACEHRRKQGNFWNGGTRRARSRTVPHAASHTHQFSTQQHNNNNHHHHHTHH